MGKEQEGLGWLHCQHWAVSQLLKHCLDFIRVDVSQESIETPNTWTKRWIQLQPDCESNFLALKLLDLTFSSPYMTSWNLHQIIVIFHIKTAICLILRIKNSIYDTVTDKIIWWLLGFAVANRACCGTGKVVTTSFFCNPSLAGTCKNARECVLG